MTEKPCQGKRAPQSQAFGQGAELCCSLIQSSDTGPSWPGCWVVCLKLPASGEERVWAELGLWLLPLVLHRVAGAPPGFSCSGPHVCCPSAVGLASKCDCSLRHKLCTTKTVLGCSTGSFYYPAYFKIFWFYDPAFILWLNARFLCPSNSFVFPLTSSVHSNMYVLEQIQHKVPEEALKVRVAGCGIYIFFLNLSILVMVKQSEILKSSWWQWNVSKYETLLGFGLNKTLLWGEIHFPVISILISLC